MRRSRWEWKFTKQRVRAVNAKRPLNRRHLQTTFDFNYRVDVIRQLRLLQISFNELISRVEPEFAHFQEFNRRTAHLNKIDGLATKLYLLVMQLAVIAKLECDDTEWMSLNPSVKTGMETKAKNLAKESNESRKKSCRHFNERQGN